MTADEMKANGRQYLEQWVLMKNVVVRSFPLELRIPLGDKSFVLLDDISKNQAPKQIVKHIEDRCYEEAEYKDIYRPEECTYSVKFRVYQIVEDDVKAENVLFVEPRN